ncbi:uncharacterized protein LOC129616968 [Condylostylus longicornis]|uniref:uncharacterized protein LOC129616968 n=1 Tax=Condylostylus longicornis TaxID=2530218 RepID=UPI00244DEF6D|nr:uncharacterized protein LOC129616968 [Condylostylus longicornis]
MLSVFKNNIFGSALSSAGQVQQREIDWFVSNYWILASQAALLSGFASQALANIDLSLQPSYLFGTLQAALLTTALMSHLYVIVASSFACLWAPALALRGPKGIESAREAKETLEELLHGILGTLSLGLFSFILSGLISLVGSTKSEKTANRSILVVVITIIIVLGSIINSMRLFYHGRSCDVAIRILETAEGIGDLDNIECSLYQQDPSIGEHFLLHPP